MQGAIERTSFSARQASAQIVQVPAQAAHSSMQRASTAASAMRGRGWLRRIASTVTKTYRTRMDRHTPTVAEVVTRAVELVDPDDVDEPLGHLQSQLEDDIEPITAVDNLEERLALALEGVDYDIENPAVSVASAIVLYLAAHPNELDTANQGGDVMTRAVKAQWHGHPPEAVERWLGDR